MRARHGRMGEGARRLARCDRRMDPGIVEEALADVRQVAREAAVGGEHGFPRFLPRDHAVVGLGQRRVAIPIGHPLLAEPPGLSLVVAMGEARIGLGHGLDQRIDHVVFDEVGQVARGDRACEAAPVVFRRLVAGQRVGDQREARQALLQAVGEGEGGLLAHGLLRVGHLVQDLGAAQQLVVEGKAQRGHRLVEQPRPGGAAGDLLVVEQALQVFAELIGAEGAQVAQPRAVARQRWL